MRLVLLFAAALTLAACNSLFDSGYNPDDHEEEIIVAPAGESETAELHTSEAEATDSAE